MDAGIKYENKALCIEMTESSEDLTLTWKGKSLDRDPGIFLTPILLDALRRAGDSKRLVLDFETLEYMNSSTIMPIIKLLNEIKIGGQKVSIHYKKSQKWQDLSFSALKVLQTRDGRIGIEGR